MNEKELALPELKISLKNVGKPQRHREFSVQKRRKFFKELMKDFNPSRAASVAKISYDAMRRTLERDEEFRAKYEEIELAVLDEAASANVILSSLVSREGYPDRRLLLEARHPLYKKNAEVQVNVQVNNIEASRNLEKLLNKIPTED
jgi:hypothetical protein